MFWCKEYNLNIIFPAKITSIWIRYNFAPLFWIQTWVTFDNRYNFIVLFSILFNNFLSNDVVSELPILLMVKLHLLWPFFFSLCCSYDHIAAASESIGRLCSNKKMWWMTPHILLNCKIFQQLQVPKVFSGGLNLKYSEKASKIWKNTTLSLDII